MRRARYFALVALVLGACGSDGRGSETAELERDLTRTVEEQTGTRNVTIDCPEDAGDGDTCAVSAPGGVKAKVTVEGELVKP